MSGLISAGGGWHIDVADAAEVVQAVRDLKLVTYATVAGTAILFYDFFLTLELEIRHIWPAPWSILKVLYLSTRYSPFIDMIPMMYHFFPGMDPHKCRIAVWFSGSVYTIGLATSELILMLRTWAVWRRSRRIGWLLGVVYFSVSVPAYYSSVLFMKSIVYAPSSPPNTPACLVISSNRLTVVDWSILMVLDGLVLALTLIKTLKNYRHDAGMGLSRLIVKDGITYYIILFTLSLLNVLIIATQPERLGLLMATPIRVILSVLTARMVLRMREHNRLAVTGGTTAALGQRTAHSLIFAPIPAPEEEARPDVQDEIEMDVSGWWAEGQGTNWANKNGAGHFQGEQEVSEGDMVFRRSSVDRQSNTSEVARSATTACDDSDPDKVDDTRNPLTGLV